MSYFHGARRHGPYFEGWYFRHQGPDGASLAVIPALHINSSGVRSASIQVITSQGSWTVAYPAETLQAGESLFQIWLGGNLFNSKGIWLDLETEGCSLHGSLRYGPFTPLKSDIMGPFRFVPGMQCSHGVISMGHRLEGMLTLNGKRLTFTGGTGYVETDRGSSFPSAYLWTQCAWREARSSSLMLSVAEIPLLGGFTGFLCAILHGGREYRLATYRGGRVERWSTHGAEIRQGAFRLVAELLEGESHPLLAPVEGQMARTIHESLRATVRYRFWEKEQLLFDHITDSAGYEYAEEGRMVPVEETSISAPKV